MTHKNRLQTIAALSFAATALVSASEAFAQAPPLNESIVIGAWTFRPSLEARLRGEYRRDAFQLGGTTLYMSDAVLGDGYQSNVPPVGGTHAAANTTDVWSIQERIRLGIAVDRGPVTAVLKMQDARVLGSSVTSLTATGNSVTPPSFGLAPFEAYIDVHARSGRAMFLRLGRQAVQWGDGRLIGTNDFTATGRALDAARAGVEAGDFDFEAMAALLGLPGFASIGATAATAASNASNTTPPATTGSQLYGLHITGHFLPLLQVEAVGLARIVRQPVGLYLTPSDTYVADLRISGEHRGFRYSVEGAYELGQVASYGALRQIQAPAAAARFEWETALPWHFTVGAQGAYASGDDGTSDAKKAMTRFDPILPDETINHSRMSLYAWSNVIEAGADLGIRPADEVMIGAGYRFVGLANPKGRWITGALQTIGSSPTNESIFLGQEVDATVKVTPWDPVAFQLGYGLFLPGDGGKKILQDSGRPADMQHYGYLQVVVKAP
ncbi:MAG: alginate export family protein [Polyangiaceae bacterium]